MSVTIREYHDRTKHSVASVRESRHFLDWENQPRPFKLYRDLAPVALPDLGERGNAAALPAIAGSDGRGSPDLRGIARLLHYSAGVTRTKQYPGGQTMRFRAAACTGALYHIDLYLVCGELDGVAAGVYHFGAHDGALRRLRGGDHRRVLVEASGGAPALAAAPAAVVCTSTFWRNAWKYQSRTYRHCYWDSGTLLANLLAVAAADGIAAAIVLGFGDTMVNRLLDLDPSREAALSIVALGTGAPPPPAAPAVEPLGLATEPLSAREVDYPLIRSAHAATGLPDGAAARDWRARAAALPDARPAADATPLPLVELRPLAAVPPAGLEAVIVRRGSARRFSRAAIDFGALSTMLQAATGRVPGDFDRAGGASLVEPYLIVNAVDGLTPGAYRYDVAAGALGRIRPGDFRREAGFLDLGQELAADAAVNVYLLADLDRVLGGLGERGYRAAQLEGGIVGGRLYLAAYALGLGATGLTFFDDEVTAFFAPDAAGKAVMFLMAIGRRARR